MTHESDEKKMTGKSHPHLFGRAARGVQWIFATRVAMQVFSMARWLILARWYLDPGDFGLMGIALLFFSMLDTFTETGFQSALIQRPGLDATTLNTAWTLSLFRCVAVFLVIWLAAPLVTAFFDYSGQAYDSSLATLIVRIMGMVMLFRGLTNIGIVHLRKDLEFRKLFFLDTACTLVDVIIAIIAAFVLKNVWALVLGKLASEALRAVLSYVLHPYRPRLAIDWQAAGELWRFGRWVFWSTVAFFLLSHGDDIFVGRFIGVTALGLYQMAYRIACLPLTEVTGVISQVSFPAYSKIQSDIPRLREAYLKVLSITALVSVPAAGFVAVFAHDFVTVFLKEEWFGIIPAVQVLALYGLFSATGTTRGPVFMALGRPRISAYIQFVRLAVMAVTIYPLTLKFGYVGTSWSVVISSFSAQLVAWRLFSRYLQCPLRLLAPLILKPAVGTMVSMAVVIGVRSLLMPPEIGIVKFMLLAVVGAAVFAGAVSLCSRFWGYEAMAILREQMGTIGKKVE